MQFSNFKKHKDKVKIFTFSRCKETQIYMFCKILERLSISANQNRDLVANEMA